MSEKLPLYDVTIIGGGPAGLYTAFYSGMRDLKTKLIECEPELGGRILLYPEKMIWDVGGIPHILGQQLITQLVEQAKTFDPTIVLNQQIVDLEKLADGTFIITAATGEKHHSKTIILTVGFGHLAPQKLDIVGADHYEETNLHYTVQELETFRGKNILISGGGNSAVDWVNELEPIANNIMVVHRRDDFGGHERNVIKMRSSAVNIYTPYEIAELHGDHGSITQVSIAHLETDHIEKISVDAVIVNHGLKYDYSALASWGIKMKDNLAIVNAQGETNIPGVYGAGDFIDQPTKVQLIAGAFTDGAHAVNSAKLHINPHAPKAAYVSSHNIRFKERNRQIGLDDENYQDVEG